LAKFLSALDTNVVIFHFTLKGCEILTIFHVRYVAGVLSGLIDTFKKEAKAYVKEYDKTLEKLEKNTKEAEGVFNKTFDELCKQYSEGLKSDLKDGAFYALLLSKESPDQPKKKKVDYVNLLEENIKKRAKKHKPHQRMGRNHGVFLN
jgi:hypothetical protein